MREPQVEHHVARPAGALQPFVASYVGYRMRDFQPGTHAGLPSRHLTFIVSLDAPLDLAVMPNPAQRPERLWAMVGGLHATPATIRHDESQHGVQLRLTPAGARTLLGARAGDLVRQVVPLDAILGHRAHELVERLAVAPTWRCRFEVLDDVLCSLAGMTCSTQATQPMRAEIAHAWRALVSSNGALDIAELARDVGWSRRHLAEQFGTELGLSPKTMARVMRVMRFEAAKRRLGTSQPVSLSEVAASCGYADQSHLTRDWKQFAGTTPGAWMRDDQLPFVQDEDFLSEAS